MHKIDNKKHNPSSSNSDALRDRLKKLNHDVRNPINGIVGMANLLIEDKDYIKVRTEDITIIKESAETIIEIIDEVLEDLGATKKESYSQGEMPLISILKKIKRLYSPLVQKKHLSFTFNNQIDTRIKVPRHLSIKLQQIIGNLVSNAIKFTEENGVIEVLTAQTAYEDQNVLNIKVKDNGISMSPDQILAFNNGQPVQRKVGTNGEQSFGMGLKHVRKVVHEEGGTITVTSLNGNGTQFSVSLPLFKSPKKLEE